MPLSFKRFAACFLAVFTLLATLLGASLAGARLSTETSLSVAGFEDPALNGEEQLKIHHLHAGQVKEYFETLLAARVRGLSPEEAAYVLEKYRTHVFLGVSDQTGAYQSELVVDRDSGQIEIVLPKMLKTSFVRYLRLFHLLEHSLQLHRLRTAGATGADFANPEIQVEMEKQALRAESWFLRHATRPLRMDVGMVLSVLRFAPGQLAKNYQRNIKNFGMDADSYVLGEWTAGRNIPADIEVFEPVTNCERSLLRSDRD